MDLTAFFSYLAVLIQKIASASPLCTGDAQQKDEKH